MQDAPRVNHVEAAERREPFGVEHGTLLDHPAGVVRREAILEVAGAGDRFRIVVEAVHMRAEPPRRQTEQPAAAADVEKPLSGEVGYAEHLRERPFGLGDARLAHGREKTPPIAAERESATPCDVLHVSRRGCPQGRSTFRLITRHGSGQ